MTEKEMLKAEIEKINNEYTIEKILCFNATKYRTNE